MKYYHKNPRTITEKQIENLRETLPELGDLGGIVHDLNSDEVIGGNQRIKAMGLLGVEPVIVERYDPPNAQGTVAVGYYEVNGEQFKYRAVMWTPRQCEKANVVANKAGGTWDFDTLANDFELSDLTEWGFEEGELISWPQEEPVEDPGAQLDKAAELQEKWGVVRGDIWTIESIATPGKFHRVMCGDSTSAEDVGRLMGGELARMVFADPPYGIGKEIENDDLKRDDWIEFYRAWTEQALGHLIDNGYVYVWGYFETLSDYWQEVVKARGDCNSRNFIVWHKPHVQGKKALEFRQFPEAYEACLVYIYGQPFQNGPWSTAPNAEHYWEGWEPIRGYLDGEREKMGWDIPTAKRIVGHSEISLDHWFGKSQWSFPTRKVYEALQAAAHSDAFRKDYDELRKDYDELRGHFNNSYGYTDLWEFDGLDLAHMHPTEKPTEVALRAVLSTSQLGEIVLDPFLGSGPSLIACEQVGRLGYGLEIHPPFVSVCLERLAGMGLEPQRVTQ